MRKDHSPVFPALAALVLGLCALSGAVWAEESPDSGDRSFGDTAASARQDLEQSLAELTELREKIAAEKLPLTRRLNDLERLLVDLRTRHAELSRERDDRNLELNNMRTEIDARNQEKGYLTNLFEEYVRGFETRVHISELQRYRALLDDAQLATDNSDLTPAQAYGTQVAVIDASLDRLVELVGGATFDGTAVSESGTVEPVTFALIGPVALFRAQDGKRSGLAEQRLGSLEPNMVALQQPELETGVHEIISTGSGTLPFDPTLGSAQKIEATQESVGEHIMKGGPVMIPILLLAASAIFVGILKWIQLARVRKPSERRVKAMLAAIKQGDAKQADRHGATIAGPTGEMLRAGLEHMDDPKPLIEEVMYEKMLETRLRLQSFLPFIAVSAAAAPLLGLLGTVTGIINTFKLITVFGTGDAKTLSSGISEALITTEFGLVVAIPSLLLHAFLSRKARRFIDNMERTAVSLLNRIRPEQKERTATEASEPAGARPVPVATRTLMPSLGAAGAVPQPEGVER